MNNQSDAEKRSGEAPRTARASTPGPRDERGVLAARILAEARASFAEHGYSGTTVRAVARAADVDPALVFHYYGSKENLLDVATTPPQSFLDQIVIAWQTPPARARRATRPADAAELAEPRTRTDPAGCHADRR